MTGSANDILCIGLSPALQRTLYIPGLRTGGVNRAQRRVLGPGGKACNAARTLTRLGHAALILGFSGGAPGQELAVQLDRIGVRHDFLPIDASTRICTTVVDEPAGQITELVEEAPWPGEAAGAQLLEQIDAHAARSKAALICGALPPGADSSLYAAMVRVLNRHQVPAFVDTSGEAFLQVCREEPVFVKMNREELLRTKEGDEDEFVRHILDLGVQGFLVTDGAHDASLYFGDKQCTLQPPPIDEVNNIGSGDAALAGTVHAWLNGSDMPGAVRFGLACGTANAMTPEPGEVDPSQADALCGKVGMS